MAVRSIRPAAAYAAAALLTVALLAGCGGNKPTTLTPEGAVAANPAAVATPTVGGGDGEYHSPCPTGGNARPFAKTRFAVHAGLALGAFHRYIYKPLRSGGFQAGAEKRKRTFLKAAVAGLFALHELRVAKGFAASNPTLCKAVEGVTSKFTALTDKLKGGTATPEDLAASKSSIDGLQGDAGKSGFPFKEQNVTLPGAS
ncbi:hypothetical protein SAMN05421505_13233 [Sinosporangium album]|uniref:Uncharacterized protein n=1 Tax=Sinosporangium album TaxID=504805 RepID=A0A1G8HHM4_9ACTN|nr:hypothetical protein [Sinosporangium album]SDI06095.1 hypothetical protein SAMN05421505_13233 [Sinosporangium album]